MPARSSCARSGRRRSARCSIARPKAKRSASIPSPSGSYKAFAGHAGCQLIFVTGTDAQSVAAVLAAVRGTPVLTVTDGQTADGSVGIVNFVLADGHVRFEIDERSAASSGLAISSKLLSLATRVRGRAGP